jgi:hypothetical protein
MVLVYFLHNRTAHGSSYFGPHISKTGVQRVQYQEPQIFHMLPQ